MILKAQFFFIFLTILLSQKGCSNDYELEVCDGDNSYNIEGVVGFKPYLLPLQIEYSSIDGLNLSPVASFDVGAGTISFSANLKDENSKHNIKLILVNNTSNGWGERTYYLENTDNITVKAITDGHGEVMFGTFMDEIKIDFSEYENIKLEIWVNNVYNPSNYSTNRQYKITASELNIRKTPDVSTNENIYCTLKGGQHVEETGKYEYVENRKWIQVCYDGYKLWVNSKHLE